MVTDNHAKKHSRRKRREESIYTPFITAGSAFALAAIINLFLIINAIVPSGSMEPAIHEGQAVIGYRAAYVSSQPCRGDVIIFRHEQTGRTRLIKRVCAIPGDTVTVEPERVLINGVIYCEYPEDGKIPVRSFIVPDGCCVVLGDNAAQSFDSRYWSDPFVTNGEIIARAVWGYYPELYKIP